MGSGESKERQEMEGKEEKYADGVKTAAACAVAAASAAALIWDLLSSSGEEDKGQSSKMMKAPGRNGELMPRNKFDEDPKGYFRDLRGKGK